MFEHANMFEHVNMLTYFSDTVTQVKPYGSFKNVLRAVKCTCEAPSVKKKKKKRVIGLTRGSYLRQQHASFFKRYREFQLVGTCNLYLD